MISKKHQDWFDDNDAEIMDLLSKKRAHHHKFLNAKENEKLPLKESFKNIKSDFLLIPMPNSFKKKCYRILF